MPLQIYQTHLLILQDDTGRRELTLTMPSYSIGREAECDICLVSKFVSRRHATLIQLCLDGGMTAYQVVDGDGTGGWSVNGILINGHKQRSRVLCNKDIVMFGPDVYITYYALQHCTDPNIDGSLPTAPVNLDYLDY